MPDQSRDVLGQYAGPLGCRGYMFRRLGSAAGGSITTPAFFRAAAAERENRAGLRVPAAARALELCTIAMPSSLLDYWPLATQIAHGRARHGASGRGTPFQWDRVVSFPYGRLRSSGVVPMHNGGGGGRWRGANAFPSSDDNAVVAALHADHSSLEGA